jgi:hypothetical protein
MSANVVSPAATPRRNRGLVLLAVAVSLASLAMVALTVIGAAIYGALGKVFWPSIMTACRVQKRHHAAMDPG